MSLQHSMAVIVLLAFMAFVIYQVGWGGGPPSGNRNDPPGNF